MVSEDSAGLSVDPVGTSCSSVTGRGEFSRVAGLAVNVSVFSIENGVLVQLLGTRSASGTFDMVALSLREDLLSLENRSSASMKLFEESSVESQS